MLAFLISFAVIFFLTRALFKGVFGGVLGAANALAGASEPNQLPQHNNEPKGAPKRKKEGQPNHSIPPSWSTPIVTDSKVREQLHDASVEAGNPIDASAVARSKRLGLPIVAENEAELRSLTDRTKRVVEGDVDAICHQVLAYEYGSDGLNVAPMKAQFLRELILEFARDGNLAAQAACMNSSVFGVDAANHSRSSYETPIREAAEAGKPDAQFAMGMFMLPATSLEALELLHKAALQGNSAAAYHLVQRIDAAYYAHGLPFPKYGRTFKFVLLGARADKGVFAGNLQTYVAEAYANGECGVAADKDVARAWYEMAVRTDAYARDGLDMLDRTFSQREASPIDYLTMDDIKRDLGDPAGAH